MSKASCIQTAQTIALLGVVSICLNGCLAVAAGAGAAGTVAYLKGDLEATVTGDPQQVTNAAASALQEMGVAVLSSRATQLDGEVLARTAQDRRISIQTKRASDNTSTLLIRVGTFGDQGLSQAIYDRIRGHL